jgi:hypothetical protein
MKAMNFKKNNSILKITIFLLTLTFGFLINQTPVLAVTDEITCPVSGTTPTEILIYYHGNYAGGNYPSLPHYYGDQTQSIVVFKIELDKIRTKRPGIIGVHVNSPGGVCSGSNCQYTNSVSTILSNINSKCGITNASSLPLSLAGHSHGGIMLRDNGTLATNKVIALDALYWPLSSSISCSKIRLIGGQSTYGSATLGYLSEEVVTRCKDDPDFKYLANKNSAISHYETIAYLSIYYLDAEASISGATVTATPPKPFVFTNPLENLQVKIPGLDQIASQYTATCTENGATTACTLPWIAIYIKAIFNYSMGIIGILAAITLMLGGVIWIVAGGNASRISESKSWISASITGLLIGITSFILLNEINPNLTSLNPLELNVIREEGGLDKALEQRSAGKVITGGYNLACMEAKYMHVTYNGDPCTADNPKGYFKCYDCTPVAGTKTVKLGGTSYTLVTEAAEALEAAIAETPANVISQIVSLKKSTNSLGADGGLVCRANVNSKAVPKSPSAHSYGVALDLLANAPGNANRHARNADGTCPTDTPIEFVDALKNNGFRWGGDYKSPSGCDSMHFEYLLGCIK